ncbi:MAG: hypothetical protein ABIJ39_08470 [Chloroflexota bacterium]
MKIVDRTPYFNEQGKIGIFDKLKAMITFGPDWLPEVEAQKSIIVVLEKILDRNYTLLRNVTLPDLEISIPGILVGPPGVYVLYVTHIKGTYQAKGDSWGVYTANNFKPAEINLMTRTAQMGRALDVFLQRQGFEGMANIEPILLCAEPTLHVDSQRPVVRVVMRDALERFAASITQARAVLTLESVRNITERVLNPRSKDHQEEQAPAPSQSTARATEAGGTESGASVPAFSVTESDSSPDSEFETWTADRFGFNVPDDGQGESSDGQAGVAPGEAALIGEGSFGEETDASVSFDDLFESIEAAESPQQKSPGIFSRSQRRVRFSRRQWILLVVIFIFECISLAIFAYLITIYL